MTSQIPRERTIAALADEFAQLRSLLSGCTDAQWDTPTALPGWDVKANVAHVIGTEAMLLGEPEPAVEADVAERSHVRNDVGAFNERWVAALADEPPAAILARFDDVTGRRLAALRELSQDEWDAESFTPAGRDSYGRFMQIRVFDCWFHEQDIREALALPGHDAGPAVEVTLDEVGTALGFVVGKRAGAPTGSRVTFELTGPAGRLVHVEVGDRAAVVAELSGPPTAVVRVPVVTFTRLCGGRIGADAAAPDLQLEGDVALATRIVENLSYTI